MWLLVIFNWNFRIFYLRDKPESTTAATFPLKDEVVFFWGSSCLCCLPVCTHSKETDEGGRRSFSWFFVLFCCEIRLCWRYKDSWRWKVKHHKLVYCISCFRHTCAAGEGLRTERLCCNKKEKKGRKAEEGNVSSLRNSCGIWCKGAKTHFEPTPQPC